MLKSEELMLSEEITEHKKLLEIKRTNLKYSNPSMDVRRSIENAICYLESKIKWLEELQQYKVFGTVDDVYKLKKKNEQIESLLRCHDDFNLSTPQKNYELVKAIRVILEIDQRQRKEELEYEDDR